MEDDQKVEELNEEAQVEAVQDATDGRVLQLPVRIVREICTIPWEEPEASPLLLAVSDWALVYRVEGELRVGGFSDKEQLSMSLTAVYRTSEIIAVLCKGRPVRFNMRVSARIG
jgi:hypothetical protein